MKTTITRIVSLLMFFCILISMTSCAGGNENAAESTAETTAAETEAERIPDNLPDVDYDGYAFRILGTDIHLKAWYVEEDDGEVVNSAIYARNLTVQERFNIRIVTCPVASDYETRDNAYNSVMSDSDEYDLCLQHLVLGANNSLSGIFYNLYDIEHLDFTKPWWPSETVEEMTFNGRMFLGSSTACYNAISGSKVVTVNKDLAASLDVEVPYDSVRDGTWTLTKLVELSKNVYNDINGNGQRDMDDTYGYTSQFMQNGYIVSCDIPVLIKHDEDCTLEIAAYSDKMVWLVETLNDWYYNSTGTYITSNESTVTDYYTTIFSSGNALFGFAQISNIVDVYRFSDVNYGILPQPKYDEAQETYRTFTSDSMICVPITVKDTEKAGIITEGLSSEGYYTIYPAFYEVALKVKIADAPDDVEMLEIINSTRAISFAYAYDNWQGFGHLFSNLFTLKAGTTDYASYYAKRLSSAEARVKEAEKGFAG